MKKIPPLVMVLLCAMPGRAQQLAVSLTADRDSLVVGEPVIVYATVTNTGSQALTVQTLFGPEYEFFAYAIRMPDGTMKKFIPLVIKEGGTRTPPVQPGGSVSGGARIYFGSDGYAFPKAGSYQITCTYGSATSPPLTLTFRDPHSLLEVKFANAMLKHGEVGMVMMMEGGDELTDGMQRLEEIAAGYPGTSYAGVAAYVLGRTYSTAAMNFVSKKPRGPDYEKANRYLEKAKNTDAGAYYIRKIYSTLADNQVKLKNSEAAARARSDLQRRLNELGRPGKIMLEEHNRTLTPASR